MTDEYVIYNTKIEKFLHVDDIHGIEHPELVWGVASGYDILKLFNDEINLLSKILNLPGYHTSSVIDRLLITVDNKVRSCNWVVVPTDLIDSSVWHDGVNVYNFSEAFKL